MTRRRRIIGLFCLGAATIAAIGAGIAVRLDGRAGRRAGGAQAAVSALPEPLPGGLEMAYPLNGAVFPPEMPAPTFRWRPQGSPPARYAVRVDLPGRGEPLAVWLDRNDGTWQPDARTWQAVREAAVEQPATFTVLAFADPEATDLVASGRLRLRIAHDPVGAAILYRDVPLPFIYAVKNPQTIRWRLANVGSEAEPPVVLENLPVCGNCHSADADGTVLGMDVDYANDKGSYAITELGAGVPLTPEKVITWSDFRRQDNQPTFGLLSRVSPCGRYVISTVKDRSVFVPRDDLAYSQLFFPIKGILAVYDRKTKRFAALPGADDPAFVQSNAAFSPDGQWVYFCRAKAEELREDADQRDVLITSHLAEQFLHGRRGFRFDIWRVPFNAGAGGKAEPVAGAGDNGTSNYFPAVSPDGKWLVFCRAQGFMLLQPDSELWMVPTAGGEPRRLACNTESMNSWHAWSPNGRWLVFSTKLRGPYTQLALAHVDTDGRSSPPVLLERAALPGRACNIPEFLNVAPGTNISLHERFLDHDNFRRQGNVLLLAGEAEKSIKLFRKSLKLNASDHQARLQLAAALAELQHTDKARQQFAELIRRAGAEASPDSQILFEAHMHSAVLEREARNTGRAAGHYRQAIELKPDNAEPRRMLGLTLAAVGKLEQAETVWRECIRVCRDDAMARLWLGRILEDTGRAEQARAEYRAALAANPTRQEDWLTIAGRLMGRAALADPLRTFVARYIDRYPRCPRGRIALARVHASDGRTDAAVQALQAALRLDPSLNWVPEKIKELQALQRVPR